jgi:hypothetical protein
LDVIFYLFPNQTPTAEVEGQTSTFKNSSVASVSVGSQIGVINAALQQISEHGSNTEFVRAIKELEDAFVNASVEPTQRQDLMDNLSTLAEQGARRPEERSKGTLKAVFGWMPSAVSTVSQLSTLWDKYSPIIKTHLGL